MKNSIPNHVLYMTKTQRVLRKFKITQRKYYSPEERGNENASNT
jgi:hypothetical protein